MRMWPADVGWPALGEPCTGSTLEPSSYDVRLRRLGTSPVIALILADLRLEVFPASYVSPISA